MYFIFLALCLTFVCMIQSLSTDSHPTILQDEELIQSKPDNIDELGGSCPTRSQIIDRMKVGTIILCNY